MNIAVLDEMNQSLMFPFTFNEKEVDAVKVIGLYI